MSNSGVPKKVLVTGHDGYIGPVLVAMLRHRGHWVRGVDAGYFHECRLDDRGQPDEAFCVDIRDLTAAHVTGVDAVVHLAALSNDPLGELDAALTLAINAEASVRLARLAKAAGAARFLFSSSCSVYGDAGAEGTVTEESAVRPLTAYARSKATVEEALLSMADGAFAPVILRNATAYGASPNLRLDLVVNNLVASAVATGRVLLMSDGTPWRPLVHVEDIARAFVAALEAPIDAVRSQVLNIGANAENYQIRDIAEAVCAAVPGSLVEYAPNAGPDARSYRVDFSKVRQVVPAFEPRWDVPRGAREIYEALARPDVRPAEFETRRFVRLKQLRHLMDCGLVDGALRPSPSRRAAGEAPVAEVRR